MEGWIARAFVGLWPEKHGATLSCNESDDLTEKQATAVIPEGPRPGADLSGEATDLQNLCFG